MPEPQSPHPVGVLLRGWRRQRRLSQLELAGDAEISTRHLSFVETGRARPSREMILKLSEHLAIPLRERNTLLVSGGYAPVYAQRGIDDPSMHEVCAAMQRVVTGHEPYPALAIDRHWNLVFANRMVALLLAGVDAALLQPPVNVLRLCLHPRGLAPRIANLALWRCHLLQRLRQQCAFTADAGLRALLDELLRLAPNGTEADAAAQGALVLPLHLHTAHGLLRLISTTTVFGAPMDVTLSELAIESFFPEDEATGDLLRRLAASAA
jgi:transcriptional regulator with XRE-family HTH domain